MTAPRRNRRMGKWRILIGEGTTCSFVQTVRFWGLAIDRHLALSIGDSLVDVMGKAAGLIR
jgi:hypothetical protein